MYPVLTLKPEKEVHLKNRHHSIFRGTVADLPKAPDGSIVEVRSSSGEFLCFATLNRQAYICGRAIAFLPGDPLAQLKDSIARAIAMRRTLLAGDDTNAYRLVNAEGDAVPGLIVDQYADTLVVQFTTLGMDRLRKWVVEVLTELCSPAAIFEKSTGAARKNEGLQNIEGWLKGKESTSIPVKEHGIKFSIDLVGSQKTGLFLDQREMRSLTRSLAKDRTVLDCCCYVGGFSVAALLGGAKHCDAVDYDAAAIEKAKAHVALNGIPADRFDAHTQDVFDFLRRSPMPHQYDFIILDPPAFAKRSSDLEQAKRAYTDLNRMALQALSAGGLLLTCSCSFQMDAALFQTVVFHAARQAKRSVKIIHRHRQAFDHPVNIYHPEADYLKSLLLWVE